MTNHQFFFQFNSISSIFLKFFQLGQPGKYAPTNLGTQVSDLVGCPYACEGGTYAVTTEKRIKLCTTCPPGHYCDDVASLPSACASGYWNSLLGQISLSSCLACPKGYHQKEEGSLFCLPCIKGEYNNISAQSECWNCPANTKNDQLNATSCLDCVLGKDSVANSAKCRNTSIPRP